MPRFLESTTFLDPDARRRVAVLVTATAAADGVDPLNEEAHLALAGGETTHWLAGGTADTPVGYAQYDPRRGTAQLFVHPRRRRAGQGRALLAAVQAVDAGAAFWAFGDSPGARALASSAGLVPHRVLHLMGRALPADDPDPLPDGFRLTHFADADAAALLAVNAAAFAHHPDQGAWDPGDLAARQAESWWDPEGLLLAWDEAGLAGFHWTKRHPDGTGEVYVLGVHPRVAGRHLGAALLGAGLAHLTARGCPRAILYVEADNVPALALYRTRGFEVTHTDALYGPAR